MPSTIQLSTRTLMWVVTSAVLAVAATLIVTQAWQVGASPGEEDATFVPTPGCRAFDFRPPPTQIGQRGTALGARETYTQQITGGVGDCVGPLTIPGDAVGVAMNVTIVDPTAQSNLRLFPADLTEVPLVSNLNFSAGQAPFPNKVDVRLSPDGAIKVFNQNGQVFVLGDVVGYYTDASLKELAAAGGGGQPFTVTDTGGGDEEGVPIGLVGSPLATVELTPPVDGHVTVHAHTSISNDFEAESAFPACGILPIEEAGLAFLGTPSVWNREIPAGELLNYASHRTFEVTAGEPGTYFLWCGDGDEEGGNVFAYAPTLTAVFTPAPAPAG